MIKKVFLCGSVLAAVIISASADAFAQIIVDGSVQNGSIKMMNAVNNGPVVAQKTQKKGNFDAYRAAGFPFARLHDSPICRDWAHTVDIDCVFPDFSADENNPESYDFTLTDKLVRDIQAAGTQVFYRLGQSIENFPKKYHVNPPEDYRKWGRICEHIIRHYNEGWADGFHYNIQYWEIWNEPDLGFKDGRHLNDASPTWNGTDTDFFRLYELASKHLKKCFPDLKIGGPALCGDSEWADRFLAYSSAHNVELDFFSYHIYSSTVENIVNFSNLMKSLADKHGYSDVEMILDEWNYVTNWTDEFVHSIEVVNSYKGAAFTAAVMQACQDCPVDMLMYYDARPGTSFNGLFNLYTQATMPTYYAMYSWNKLRKLENRVKATAGDLKDVFVTSAKGADGRSATLVTYFPTDKGKSGPIPVSVEFRDIECKEFVGHVTDKYKLYTEIPLDVEDGKVNFFLESDSFILIETR